MDRTTGAFNDGRQFSPRYKFRNSRNDTIEKMRFILDIESTVDNEFEPEPNQKEEISYPIQREEIKARNLFPRCIVRLQRLPDAEIKELCKIVKEGFQENTLEEISPKEEEHLLPNDQDCVKNKITPIPFIRVRTVEEINKLSQYAKK